MRSTNSERDSRRRMILVDERKLCQWTIAVESEQKRRCVSHLDSSMACVIGEDGREEGVAAKNLTLSLYGGRYSTDDAILQIAKRNLALSGFGFARQPIKTCSLKIRVVNKKNEQVRGARELKASIESLLLLFGR